MVLLAPCSKGESPPVILAPSPGDFWQLSRCGGDGWWCDPLFSPQLGLLQHLSTDGGPILAPHSRAAGTLHPSLPGGSHSLLPTTKCLLAPCPGGTDLLVVPSADRSQSCFYLFKSHLATIGFKNPMTTLLYNFVR